MQKPWIDNYFNYERRMETRIDLTDFIFFVYGVNIFCLWGENHSVSSMFMLVFFNVLCSNVTAKSRLNLYKHSNSSHYYKWISAWNVRGERSCLHFCYRKYTVFVVKFIRYGRVFWWFWFGVLWYVVYFYYHYINIRAEMLVNWLISTAAVDRGMWSSQGFLESDISGNSVCVLFRL